MENNNFNPIASRPRRTSREMFPLVEQWLDSGEKQSDFCQFHSLTVSTFTYWVRKYREKNNAPKSGGSFVPLSFQSPTRGELEISYPNGVKIRAGLEAGIGFIRELAGQC